MIGSWCGGKPRWLRKRQSKRKQNRENRLRKKKEKEIGGPEVQDKGVDEVLDDELVAPRVARNRRAARSKAVSESGPDDRTQELSGLGVTEQVHVVKRLLKQVERKLRDGDVRASLGDYIRLVQLHKELDEETPREIKVTWVDPKETEAK